MRIVHLIPALTLGGAEKVAVELANGAAAHGHEVALVAAAAVEGSTLAAALDERVSYRTIAPAGSGKASRYGAALRWAWRERRWLLAHDVVHCHLTLAALIGTVLHRLRPRAGIPAIVETIHAVGMPIPPAMRRRIAFFARERDGVALMAKDDYWQSFARQQPGTLVRFIPNGIRPAAPVTKDAARAAFASLSLPDGAFVVGNIGRLVGERMPHRLVEAFAAGFADDPRAHLVMGGDGPEREALASQAAALGLSERVHFPGLVTDAPALLSLCDLYLSINVGDTTGIAGLEAAFAGVPVVALQTIPGREPQPDDWIWSAHDPAAVGAHLAELAHDPARRARLAEQQYAIVDSRFSARTMNERYDAFYADVINARRARHAPSDKRTLH